MLNILQIHKNGDCQLMFGMSVETKDREVVERFLKRYRDDQPKLNQARVANGHPPLECEYVLIECDTLFTSDVVREIVEASS